MTGALPDFSALSPMDVADAAEAALGVRVDPVVVPYPSYINRVYGLTAEDGGRFIAKFYRPGRWSEASIREEHRFAAECAEAGVPVLAPLADASGETLNGLGIETDGGEEKMFFFAVYPFFRGRGWEPSSEEGWIALGRSIAGMHEVGARRNAPSRPILTPAGSAFPALNRLGSSGLIAPDAAAEFVDLCRDVLDEVAPLFNGLGASDGGGHGGGAIRLHGDLHRGNALDSGDGQPVFIDFDDMAVGPAVQDLWLFLPGRLEDSRKEIALLLEGYEEIRFFDRSTLRLIEPLRFMRMLSYLDWQSRQRGDAGFSRAFPDWGTRAFWIKELEDLRDQARVIRESYSGD